MDVLKQTFLELCSRYSTDNLLAEKYWSEIEEMYSGKGRHYHNLSHLQNLLSELKKVDNEIKEWDTILFSLFYHDIVYNALKSNNEEKSAEMAEKRMKSIAVPFQLIENCKAQILATKQHLSSSDLDTNLFTDADLSILGKDWPIYEAYAQQVRKEYSIYPDLIYKPGRKKVLKHFLAMERIFKTDNFYNRYEKQAKDNLKKELDSMK